MTLVTLDDDPTGTHGVAGAEIGMPPLRLGRPLPVCAAKLPLLERAVAA